MKIGKNVNISPHCFIGNSDLRIGDNSFVNYNAWFNTAGGIDIGTNCNIAYGVTFVTSTHVIGNRERRSGTPISDGIVIGNGTWIGANAIILPGVRIGNGVIIGAGSVVTKNCEANCIYAGNPAKEIRKLEQ